MRAKAHRPLIETWYETAQGDVFEVVAVEEDAVEVQFLDGSVDELDRETWAELLPRRIAPPHEAATDDEAPEHPKPRREPVSTLDYYREWSPAHDEDEADDR